VPSASTHETSFDSPETVDKTCVDLSDVSRREWLPSKADTSTSLVYQQSTFTCLTINIVERPCCGFVLDAACAYDGVTTTWLETFVRQLPHLRKVRFRVCVSMNDSAECALSLTHMLGMIYPMLTELEVLSWAGGPCSSTPLGTWSKERGMQRHHDAMAAHEARVQKSG
jgi:hypothetical protein